MPSPPPRRCRRDQQLKQTLPEGVEVVYPYDTTPFVRLSIEKVVRR
jgi:multidrug efflux pump subunit AcrB